ncbi:efflux RND transporter permease subunit [Desulfopila sp. IMCC35008]|uniref:efflux RND transporter permease subunit n=1 Tax=Desulfopila sp. IMCC35008 TaxID=2653858 RepID=UPI0013D58F08|nr:multidrug efflux RND transporter permease subunit [Desulfopila sp. IMCC35008]
MISRYFIDRPIFATVIFVIIVLAGLAAMRELPVAQYPNISPVQVTVSASYPGASAEIVARNLAAPIEQQINGVDNMLYMSSSSSSAGSMSLVIVFQNGTDPNKARSDVQDCVNRALPSLPQVVTQQGVTVSKVSSSFMMVIAILSPDGRYDDTYVGNYANLSILDGIKRVPGASQSNILGMPDYAMRVWLNPDRMAQLGITASEVAAAIRLQNEQFAIGSIGQPPNSEAVTLTFPVVTEGQMTMPSQFSNLIIRSSSDGNTLIRLKDVGRVELGSRDYSLRTKLNGKDATLIGVYQQPGSNAIEVSDKIRQTLAEMEPTFPAGIDYKICLDTTEFVRASIHEVVMTFFEACFLVVLVVFVFLGTLRATIIPIIAIPVSLIGTFIGMEMFGFSINMLTLFGLVLAIGLVVDDAIVVVENVERNMRDLGLAPREAAKKAMDEVTGPVIATTLVVMAVFVPVAFLDGMTGQLYKQFAVTIAFSVFISSLVALIFSPALAVLLLKPVKKEKFVVFRVFDRLFERLTRGYLGGVRLLINWPVMGQLLMVVLVVVVWQLFTRVPTSFVPPEDQGYLFGVYLLPDSASLDRTVDVAGEAAKAFIGHPAVAEVAEFSGFNILDGQSKSNAGLLFVSLKNFDQRTTADLQAPALIATADAKLTKIREAMSFAINPPAIPGLGVTGGINFWVQSRGVGGVEQLGKTINGFIAEARKDPALAGLSSTLSPASRQLLVEVDREHAETLGIPLSEIFTSLQAMFGSMYVSQFSKYSRQWYVILQADGVFRDKPEDIGKIFVRGRGGTMLPLKTIVTSRFVAGPDLVSRFNGFLGAQVTAKTADGFSSGQAMDALERLALQHLPTGYALNWAGQAYEERQAGSSSLWTFVFGLLMAFLILAAQYERWSLPFAVLLAVPFALFGALAAIWLRNMENDVYFQIGLLTLIALAAKNAIMIVEFALLKRQAGLTIKDAALEAARLRLRPVVMTSFAFILGCIPLAIASGASANSRHSIGTGVIGGMLGATLLATFFIPLLFTLLQGFSERFFTKKKHGPEFESTET